MDNIITHPWGGCTGPFTLSQYSSFPKGPRESIPKFNGEKTHDPNDHIRAVTITHGVVCVKEEDVFVRLFVGSLIDNVSN